MSKPTGGGAIPAVGLEAGAGGADRAERLGLTYAIRIESERDQDTTGEGGEVELMPVGSAWNENS